MLGLPIERISLWEGLALVGSVGMIVLAFLIKFGVVRQDIGRNVWALCGFLWGLAILVGTASSVIIGISESMGIALDILGLILMIAALYVLYRAVREQRNQSK